MEGIFPIIAIIIAVLGVIGNFNKKQPPQREKRPQDIPPFTAGTIRSKAPASTTLTPEPLKVESLHREPLMVTSFAKLETPAYRLSDEGFDDCHEYLFGRAYEEPEEEAQDGEAQAVHPLVQGIIMSEILTRPCQRRMRGRL